MLLQVDSGHTEVIYPKIWVISVKTSFFPLSHKSIFLTFAYSVCRKFMCLLYAPTSQGSGYAFRLLEELSPV